MSDVMRPMSFEQLLTWILTEKKQSGSVFGEQTCFVADHRYDRTMFGRKLETPVGPAAGPHTQLTQNIVAAYYTGSRFFELKTVQIMDGEELAACVNKPCIKADDECYNCEWSTELYVPQAMEEYIKAWFLCKVIAKEFALGAMDGFQFNISVGYDLEGIKSEKIDRFLNTMKHADDSEIFRSCKQYLLDHVDLFDRVTREDIEAISGDICNSVTISTLHGCPPQEIEKIAMYLITEKGFHTFIKCNPTLLGYEFARKTMDEMGYDYVAFGDFHFLDDLQYVDAVPMLTRLMAVCKERGLEFGVKITNTFPVDVKQNELPSEEMYMSGKSLYPLSIALAAKLSKEFDGALRISYSGGADFYNIKGIVDAGIWPVTVATTLLKPGGYERMIQIAELFTEEGAVFTKVDADAVQKLADEAKVSRHHVKAIKPLPTRKMKQEVPLVDCFVAPCREGCPIHQDIPAYLQLVEEGKYEEALAVITEKNPLPFITGVLCAHPCMTKCTRNFYEDSVHIRNMKLIAARKGNGALYAKLSAPAVTMEKKAAVIGGGPAGMSAAYFLRRAGMAVTLFEKEKSLGGIVRHTIPAFRISHEDIDMDALLLEKMGVEVRLGAEIRDVQALKAQGYGAVVVAVGAYVPGAVRLEKGHVENALEFLAENKAKGGHMDLGKNVVVIGGGNTAMDTVRAAKRTDGVEHAYLVYRRTKRYMPADEEELIMALEDGVEFMELLSPVAHADGKLLCDVMKLGDVDASGRRGVQKTGEQIEIPADTVIAAVGESVPSDYYKANGINVNERGKAYINEETFETSAADVYLAGDGLYGPATIVEAIRDGKRAAETIVGKELARSFEAKLTSSVIYERKNCLTDERANATEGGRCFNCSEICENCAEVCPNRANLSLAIPGLEMKQILHVDYMCNECGNCESFCPYSSAPYLDKFTLFADESDMADSKNQGFAVLDKEQMIAKVRFMGEEFYWKKGEESRLPFALGNMIEAVCTQYAYLLR